MKEVVSGIPGEPGDEHVVRDLSPPSPEIAQALQPDGLRPHRTLYGTVSSLHRLPFLDDKLITRNLVYNGEDYDSTYIENVEVPLSRIISVVAFQSWAGRGYHEGKIVRKGSLSSAFAIHDYSHRKTPKYTEDRLFTYFRDGEGEVWAYASVDGAHRTAAAKLRGDTTARGTIETFSYENLPVFRADIGRYILDMQEIASTPRNRLSLTVDAAKLTIASLRHDRAQQRSTYGGTTRRMLRER